MNPNVLTHNASTCNALTYSDVFSPSSAVSRTLYNVFLILGGSMALAISAQVYIPLPFTPVPITGQTLVVLLLGALLGSKKGTLAVITYLGLGFIGLPLFAAGGVGLSRLLGPTGGYLAGFVAAAYITGFLAERGWDRRIVTAGLAMLAGNIVIYLFGLPRLAGFVGWNKVLSLGLYPFVIGDITKIVTAMLILPAGWKLIRR